MGGQLREAYRNYGQKAKRSMWDPWVGYQEEDVKAIFEVLRGVCRDHWWTVEGRI